MATVLVLVRSLYFRVISILSMFPPFFFTVLGPFPYIKFYGPYAISAMKRRKSNLGMGEGGLGKAGPKHEAD